MDHNLFDRLAISLATRESPGKLTRRAAGVATALALALGIGGLAVEDADAKSCRNKCKKKDTKKKRRRCRKKCKNKGKCNASTDCGNCETCTNGKCVSACTSGQTCLGTGDTAMCCNPTDVCGTGADATCCPADRCISTDEATVCCPENFIACGLACCGDTTPVCLSPGSCGSI